MKIISQLKRQKFDRRFNKDSFVKLTSNNFDHCIDQGELPYELKHYSDA